MELVIADPSSAIDSQKNTFQSIFTKFNSSSNELSYSEMCSRLMKAMDDDRRAVKFMLKQFVADTNSSGQRTGNMGRAYQNLHKEFTLFKQSANSQRIQHEQTIADLQHRVQALTGSLQEQQKKNAEKDTQLNQFRQLYASEARVPGSSHSSSSGGDRHHHLRHHRTPPSAGSGGRGPSHQQPPMQGFIVQKQARERANRAALDQMTRSRVPVGPSNSSSDMDSVITPIQVPPPHHQQQHHHMMNSSSHGGIPPSTPRIRDLSAGSAYRFTSRSREDNKRRRGAMDGPPSSSISPGYAFSSGGRPPQSSQGGGGGFRRFGGR